MELRVLGRMAVVVDGREHVLGATREAALLADLIVHAGQVVSASRLVEDLWRGAPPQGAAGTLQTYVKNLRRLLEPERNRWAEGTVVSTVRPGYLLRLAPDGLDAWRCEHMVGEGRAALAGDPGRAAGLLREALALCRGPAFGALATEQYLEAEAARLDELQLVAFELRVDADLALGRHGEVAGELQAVAAANPYRESLWRQWMLSLYRAGRQADAVRAYQQLRRTLADELGLEPGAELRAVEVAMLQQRPQLDWVPPAAPVDAVSRPAAHPAPELTEPLGVEAAGPVPLPARLAVRPAVGVVGRDAALVVVGDCVERVSVDGGREVVVVSGEAGVGKTTLIAEAARVAFDGGACVLFGHCEEDLATPYQLFAEALGHLVEHAPDDVLAPLVGGDGAVLAGLLPGLVRRLPGVGSSTAANTDTGRYQLFAAVVDCLARLSARQPVVLVLEDLQWADRASLHLLRHVVGSDRLMRLVVIGSCRDRELTRSHPMADTLAELHRLGGVTRVDMVGLDDTGVAAFVEAAGGQALDEAELVLAAEVSRETGGNPFFVGEVLRHLAETGALARDDSGRWSATVAVAEMVLPPSVQTVIGSRVGRLGGEAQRVLSLAAVIGRDFDLDLLTTAAGMGDDDVLTVLDAAAGASLVRELTDTPGHYSFVHALIQHAVYAALGRTRQARAHRQVAAALEAVCGDRPGARVGELARHWSAAPRPDGLSKALEHTRRAADDALAALAPTDALGYYTQALDLLQQCAQPDPLIEVDLRIGLGVAQRQAGRAAFRETLLAAARQAADLGDNDGLAAAALANYHGVYGSASVVKDRDRVDILEVALERVRRDHPARPLLLAGLCSELIFSSDLQRREDLADEAITLARAIDDDATIVSVLIKVLWPLAMPQLLTQSLEWSAEALQRAQRLGDPVLLFWAADLRAAIALSAGDIPEMEQCLATAWSIAERLDQPFLSAHRASRRTQSALLAGDTGEAKARAIDALDIARRSGHPAANGNFASQIGAVNTQRGVFPDDRVTAIERARERMPALRVLFTAMLASEHARAGRLELAHELLDEFAASDFEPLPEPNGWLLTMIHFTDVAIACDDQYAAAALYERLVPCAGQFCTRGSAPCHPPIDHYLGKLATLLGRYEQADRHFTGAAAFADRAGAAYLAAVIDLAWGEMLLHRRQAGDEQAARGRLDAARSAATIGGYADIERRATDAVRRLG